jgi:hypothetical protein
MKWLALAGLPQVLAESDADPVAVPQGHRLLFAAIVFPSFETVEIAILALADAAFGKPVATERMCG